MAFSCILTHVVSTTATIYPVNPDALLATDFKGIGVDNSNLLDIFSCISLGKDDVTFVSHDFSFLLLAKKHRKRFEHCTFYVILIDELFIIAPTATSLQDYIMQEGDDKDTCSGNKCGRNFYYFILV